MRVSSRSWVSSSSTVTATSPAPIPSYLESLAEATVWVMVAVSSSASASWAAETVMVCPSSQSEGVKVRTAGLALTSVPEVPPGVTVTSSVGWERSTMV